MSTATAPAALASTRFSSSSMANAATTAGAATSEAAISSGGAALSVLLSASLSLHLSNLASAATGVPASVASGILSDVSGLLATSDASSQLSESYPGEMSSVSSINPGNDTTTSAPPVTSTSGINTTTSSLLSVSTSTGFLTSSFPRNSTTTASQTSSSSEVESTLPTESALFWIATLSQGDVTTFPQSAATYTTFVNGNTLSGSAARSSPSSLTDFVSSSASGPLSDRSSSRGRQTTSTIASSNGAGDNSSQYPIVSQPIPTDTESDSNNNSSSTPPAGTIAGGVVGGAAGLAVIVLIAMLAVRWYRRHSMARHQALPQGPGSSADPNAASHGGPGMAERAGLAPIVAAVPALFRHQSRAGGGDQAAQRGFTRVSGRKLPSAFGGGAGDRPPSDAPVDRDDDTAASIYRDSSGFYGGDGASGSPPSPSGSFPLPSNSYEQMTLSPGPQRTPRLHSGGPYNMSPGGSVGSSSPQAVPALTRSDAPFLLDPNRNSRFSERL
ncbi:uncharacterized protein RCC_02981 [Ramularia collo-cygni]|uniref:Uncharacterized protein n=1 Tax=Ramularia collo-cygni TaxID=112498 RepID=A0A2D3V6N6_9PEZI|nr:uncharacterized protein RCC_02981 [Ramularia collo-cygni]CZT17149.1 uncharacterized protein RCC_02981 [Ramularia collo-cygni]